MRKADAPAAGWYPDPENLTRLRWWDGLDWTDIRRAVPSDAELIAAKRLAELTPSAQDIQAATQAAQIPQQAITARYDAQQLVAEVRQAARDEVDRAALLFTQRAENAVRSVSPLISDYTSTALRWLRRALVIATILVVAWFVFQTIMQASFFEWLGDRIDNLTDESRGVTVVGPPT